MNSLCTEALKYAERGLAVFPIHCIRDDGRCSCGKPDCSSPGKHPITPHGCLDATTDCEQIRRWWSVNPDANIGMATGETSGVWVLDVERDGLADLKHLEATNGDRLPDVPTSRTGGGGRHLFFSLNGESVSNRTKIAGLQIDVRGTGGYVLLPPSNHVSGSAYSWLRSLDDYESEDAPQWLINAVTSQSAANGCSSKSTRLADASGSSEGSRHDDLVRLVGSEFARGCQFEDVLRDALNWAKRCSPPHDESDVRQVVNDIAQREFSSLQTAKNKTAKNAPLMSPDLLRAAPDRWVMLTERPEDAEQLTRLRSVAFCNPENVDQFRGRQVLILAKRQTFADELADRLKSTVSRLRIKVTHGLDWLGRYDEGDEYEHLLLRYSRRERTNGAKSVATPIRIIPAVELVREFPHLRPPIVDGLLRKSEVMNVIAAPKVGKSWLTHGLALSVSCGTKWLNYFQVTQGPVLLIDNELHPETLSSRLAKVAETTGLNTSGIDVLPLRGNVMSYHQLEPIVDQIEAGRYALIAVDAHYRMLPDGVTENSNAEMMRIYNLIDSFAAVTGAAWTLIHHSSKGDQSGKDVTDVGAGAGSQSRATDAHLIIRKHETDGAFVLEAAVRSFAPVEPLVLRWEYPLWLPDDSLNPHQLETTRSKKQKRDDEEARSRIVEALQDGPNTSNKLARSLGMGPPRCLRLLNGLIDDGIVAGDIDIVSNNETTIYRLANEREH